MARSSVRGGGDAVPLRLHDLCPRGRADADHVAVVDGLEVVGPHGQGAQGQAGLAVGVEGLRGLHRADQEVHRAGRDAIAEVRRDRRDEGHRLAEDRVAQVRGGNGRGRRRRLDRLRERCHTILEDAAQRMRVGRLDIVIAHDKRAQADGRLAVEPTMDVEHVAKAVAYMASLPLDANVQFMTVMAAKMPFIGRG